MPEARGVVAHIQARAELAAGAEAMIVLSVPSQARLGLEGVPMSMYRTEQSEAGELRRLVGTDGSVGGAGKTRRRLIAEGLLPAKIQLGTFQRERPAKIELESRACRVRPVASQIQVDEM